MGCFHGKAINDCAVCDLVDAVRLLTGEHLGPDAAIVRIVTRLQERLDTAEDAVATLRAGLTKTRDEVARLTDLLHGEDE